jgi:hypothetical protein
MLFYGSRWRFYDYFFLWLYDHSTVLVGPVGFDHVRVATLCHDHPTDAISGSRILTGNRERTSCD